MLRDEDIERVKSAVSMKQLAECYGFRVNRAGFMCCPFHNEKTPSMKVYSGQKGYCCYGCGEAGDVIRFVREYETLTFEDAVRRIAGMLSIPISEADKPPTPEETEEFCRRKLLREIDRNIESANKAGLIEISEKIQLYQWLMDGARPFGELWCYLADRLPVLQGEWEWLFELRGSNKK